MCVCVCVHARVCDLLLSSEVRAPPFPLVDEGPPALSAEDLQTAGRVALVPRPAGLPTARRTRPMVQGAAVGVAVSLSGVSVTECVWRVRLHAHVCVQVPYS